MVRGRAKLSEKGKNTAGDYLVTLRGHHFALPITYLQFLVVTEGAHNLELRIRHQTQRVSI